MGTWDTNLPGVIALPDGSLVRGRALRGPVPEKDAAPDFGVYLTFRPHREPEWECRWVCWPDFGLPRSSHQAVAALIDAYDRAARMKVEIACGGGRGRTGTAIAILARHAGIPAQDAVAWVRANYRPDAIETPWQRRFARRVPLAHGLTRHHQHCQPGK